MGSQETLPLPESSSQRDSTADALGYAWSAPASTTQQESSLPIPNNPLPEMADSTHVVSSLSFPSSSDVHGAAVEVHRVEPQGPPPTVLGSEVPLEPMMNTSVPPSTPQYLSPSSEIAAAPPVARTVSSGTPREGKGRMRSGSRGNTPQSPVVAAAAAAIAAEAREAPFTWSSAMPSGRAEEAHTGPSTAPRTPPFITPASVGQVGRRLSGDRAAAVGFHVERGLEGHRSQDTTANLSGNAGTRRSLGPATGLTSRSITGSAPPRVASVSRARERLEALCGALGGDSSSLYTRMLMNRSEGAGSHRVTSSSASAARTGSLETREPRRSIPGYPSFVPASHSSPATGIVSTSMETTPAAIPPPLPKEKKVEEAAGYTVPPKPLEEESPLPSIDAFHSHPPSIPVQASQASVSTAASPSTVPAPFREDDLIPEASSLPQPQAPWNTRSYASSYSAALPIRPPSPSVPPPNEMSGPTRGIEPAARLSMGGLSSQRVADSPYPTPPASFVHPENAAQVPQVFEEEYIPLVESATAVQPSSNARGEIGVVEVEKPVSDAVHPAPPRRGLPCIAVLLPRGMGLAVVGRPSKRLDGSGAAVPPSAITGHVFSMEEALHSVSSETATSASSPIEWPQGSGRRWSWGARSTPAGRKYWDLLRTVRAFVELLSESALKGERGDAKTNPPLLTSAVVNDLLEGMKAHVDPTLIALLSLYTRYALEDEGSEKHPRLTWSAAGRQVLAEVLDPSTTISSKTDDTTAAYQFLRGPPPSLPSPDFYASIERLVCRRRHEEAAELALQKGCWADALLLSLVCPTPATLQRTVDVYTSQYLHSASPLAQAYRQLNELPLSLGADTPPSESAADFTTLPAPTLLQTWQRHCSLQLSNYASSACLDRLVQLSDLLVAVSVEGAHTCLLVLDLCLQMQERHYKEKHPSAASPETAPSRAEVKRRELRQALSLRLNILGGLYFSRKRSSFLSPVTTTLTTILQACRQGFLRTSSGEPAASTGIPARDLQYAVGLHCMVLLWLRESGLLDGTEKNLIKSLLGVLPPSCSPRTPLPTSFLSGSETEGGMVTADVPSHTFPPDLSVLVCLVLDLPLVEAPPASPPARRAPVAETVPSAVAPANKQGGPPRQKRLVPNPLPDVARLGAIESPNPTPSQPKDVLPPPPAKTVPAGPPQPVARGMPPSTGAKAPPVKEKSPSQDAEPPRTSRARTGSIERIKHFFFRSKTPTPVGVGKDGKEEDEKEKPKEVKKMILDTEKPPAFDPASGRWLFEQTEEEKAQAELVKRGPPKMPSAGGAKSAAVPPPGHTPGVPPPSSSPSAAGAPVLKRSDGPPGSALRRRAGAPLRPQYVDMFNSM